MVYASKVIDLLGAVAKAQRRQILTIWNRVKSRLDGIGSLSLTYRTHAFSVAQPGCAPSLDFLNVPVYRCLDQYILRRHVLALYIFYMA